MLTDFNFRLIALFSGLLLLAACNKEGELDDPLQSPQTTASISDASEQSADIQDVRSDSYKIVAAHTSGYVSRDSNIRVTFTQPVVKEEQVSQDLDNVLKITPPVSGNAVFKSTQELIFIPEKGLESGQRYTVEIQTKALSLVTENSNHYRFSFNTIPLDFEVSVSGLANDVDKLGVMVLTGTVLTSDRVSSAAVEKMLSFILLDEKKLIQWEHSENGKKHTFSIEDIPREPHDGIASLSWDAASLGVDRKGSQEISIPALNKISLVNMQWLQNQEGNRIEATFSDTLDITQDLRGLLKITKKGGGSPLPLSQYNYRINHNVIQIFPIKTLEGVYSVHFYPGIRSFSSQKKLSKKIEENIAFERLKPQVRFSGNGNILPKNEILDIPFEAVSVNAVQVTAFEIYPNNIGQLLQTGGLDQDHSLGRVGRYLWKKTINLNPADPYQWNSYSLNVTDLMKTHPDSLIQLTLSIDRRHAHYDCPVDAKLKERMDSPLMNYEDDGQSEASGWDGIENYQQDEYKYQERNNPCSDTYYLSHRSEVTDSRNFISSNIGLLAKRNAHNDFSFIATDLQTAEPLSGAQLEIKNYQQQTLATVKTDAQGFARLPLTDKPFLVIARHNNDVSYLKLNNNSALSTSHFDVGGVKIEKGIREHIYGERGVWRPGDAIYLTFVAFDKDEKLPNEHPVTLKLFDPLGKEIESQTNRTPTGGFYSFRFSTDEKAPTGRWMVKGYLGGQVFSKPINIELVRPNRLKVELDFLGDVIYGYKPPVEGVLSSQWLHGGSANGLKADVSVRLREKTTKFTRFDDYQFDDPTRSLDSQDQKIVEGHLNDEGVLSFSKKLSSKQKAPGMLSAWFTSRVFEKGGAFSISRQFVDYYPYENYVGLKLPKGDATRNMLLTDKKHTVSIGSLNAKGEPVSLDEVQVTLYKIDWKWWWDKSTESLARYADANHSSKLQQSIIQTQNGVGEWQFDIKYPDWGRYLIRACDLQGQHCTGKTLYVDWPGWAGRAQEQGGSAASMLTLFSDKKAYNVGETATIQLPEASQGRALITVETGSDILKQEWVVLDGKRQQLALPITAEMAPNAYFSLTLLQPHQDRKNDRPLRLYGITPITVNNPETVLSPVIDTSEEWKPNSSQTVTVSEKNGKAMTYTLAVVDEGLLGLTRFKTPDLHNVFYRKEKLGVKTWDLYDYVVGAYGGQLERLLAIGGGDDVQLEDDSSRQRRFPPVVQVQGPFCLAAGEKKQHVINLPPYLGAVRVMLVAGSNQGAFGKTEESVFVRQPLMLQPSLPRVLKTGETVDIPVTLFATDDSIKDVNLKVVADEYIDVIGNAEQAVQFDQPGEKLAYIKLRSKKNGGQSNIHIIATSGVHSSEKQVHLDIVNSNPQTRRVASQAIDAHGSWDAQIDAYGLKGSNSAVLEVSAIPPLNLDKHLDYLLSYPHGCLEQVTSAAFPQLYLPNLVQMSEEKLKKNEHHIKRAIEHLHRFQKADGNFSYWENNGNEVNQWASIYAGHFLISAQQQGYSVPINMLASWLKYQHMKADSWVTGNEDFSHQQAYRLYVLALAGKPSISAMNRLKSAGVLNAKTRWMLASAYELTGQKEAANVLTEGLLSTVEESRRASSLSDNTFSSYLSDMGQQLDMLTSLQRTQDAELLVSQISKELGIDDKLHNTHGIAWALAAVSRFYGGKGGEVSANFQFDQAPMERLQGKALVVQKIFDDIDESKHLLKVENSSDKKLYTTIITKGIPEAGGEQQVSNGLSIETVYLNAESRQSILVGSQNEINQGSDIIIQVKITNTLSQDLHNIALSIPLPSGWEIHNANYESASNNDKNTLFANSEVDHQDVRDDRVFKYFSLQTNETKYFNLLVNAAYKGEYYLPAISAEVMYNPEIRTLTVGKYIQVVDQKDNTLLMEAQENPSANKNSALGKVISLKAWLYHSPSDEDKSKMYLIKDDQVTILRSQTVSNGMRWLFIRFEGKKTIDMWIRSDDLSEEEFSG